MTIPHVPMVESLELEPLEKGKSHRFWVKLAEDSTCRSLSVPVMVARGLREGPVVGITAAIHGNELNGIPTIHRLFAAVDPAELKGTIVAVPVINILGYMIHARKFIDGVDLNRIMPGKENGNVSQVYAHRFMHRIVHTFQYLIDLHTASFGRVNSFYVRADMTHSVTSKLARLISPQIIVHNTGRDGTLRAAAEDRGIHAVTVEIGNPQRFQRGMIRSSGRGIQAVLDHLDMFDHDEEPVEEATIECSRSYWLYTDVGGALHVLPDVTDRVKKGQRIAIVTNLFGDVVREYHAPEDGVVVGKNANPVAQTGAGILHLGIEGKVELAHAP